MLILCLDSSAAQRQFFSVFDSGSGFLIKEAYDGKSSDLIASLVAKFDEIKLKPSDLNLITVLTGPGSFTGLRTVITIAKTLSLELEIPVLPISIFELMGLPIDLNQDLDFTDKDMNQILVDYALKHSAEASLAHDLTPFYLREPSVNLPK